MTIAKVTEVIASSETSFDDAIKSGIARANKTIQGISSVWVKDQSVKVDNGNIVQYRVNLAITFVLKD